MALQSNAFAILQQNKQKRNEIWHEDFFATMNNKVWDEPSLTWEPGMANIEYTGLTKGNPTKSWSTYSAAAKSRGMRPNYNRFMETYKSIKATRESKVLDSFSQLSTMYANNDDFKKALKNTIRANPELRNDLSEGMRLNPEHPGNANIQLAFQEYGQDPTTAATNKAYSGAMDRFNPLDPSMSTIRTAGTAGAAGMNWAAGRLTGKQALGRALTPGMGFYDAGRALAGKGPYAGAKGSKFARTKAGIAERRKFMDASKQNKGKTWRGYNKGRFASLDKNMKTLNSIQAPGVDDFRTKANQSKIRGWKKDLQKNLRRGVKDLKSIRGDLGKSSRLGGNRAALQAKLDKEIKGLNKANKALTEMGKNGKKITKKVFQKTVSKNIGQTGAKTLGWAVKKVGWGGILKRAGWKLGAKIVASGVMKAGSAVTYGASGLISLGMDAWTAVEVGKLIADIYKEYNTQSTAQSQGSTQYKTGVRRDPGFKGYANI